ncbi:winged helix-turn-helix domain-containing protein [Nitrosomonas eutropha]|uniref:winged helix-turn-helix domain-containing protein n=1 Tax=Nitrosomonas eutropha TaxID=916 RepID=UPI0008C7D88F|nr:winged helix-turn-helix domain-containing protein [Nitrosomonas eutropha]SEJ36949.1 restriction system protein [Nitrosomonas eutropha]
MSIPKHDQIRVPALSLLADRGQLKLREFEQPLAKYFGLSDSEVQEEYDSGNGKIFYDRISWALSYMNMAGLLNKPKWGVYEINELGKERLKAPEVLNQFIAAQFTEQQVTWFNKPDSPVKRK